MMIYLFKYKEGNKKMPLLNFEHRFADKIESGEKRQTIRTVRKYPIKTGDELYLYTGARTKNCRKLKTEFDKTDKNGKTFVVCKSVEEIDIDITPEHCYRQLRPREDIFRGKLYISGYAIMSEELEDFVVADGFDKISYFFKYFWKNYGSYFKGVLIKW